MHKKILIPLIALFMAAGCARNKNDSNSNSEDNTMATLINKESSMATSSKNEVARLYILHFDTDKDTTTIEYSSADWALSGQVPEKRRDDGSFQNMKIGTTLPINEWKKYCSIKKAKYHPKNYQK